MPTETKRPNFARAMSDLCHRLLTDQNIKMKAFVRIQYMHKQWYGNSHPYDRWAQRESGSDRKCKRKVRESIHDRQNFCLGQYCRCHHCANCSHCLERISSSIRKTRYTKTVEERSLFFLTTFDSMLAKSRNFTHAGITLAR